MITGVNLHKKTERARKILKVFGEGGVDIDRIKCYLGIKEYSIESSEYLVFNSSVSCLMCNKDHKSENITLMLYDFMASPHSISYSHYFHQNFFLNLSRKLNIFWVAKRKLSNG